MLLCCSTVASEADIRLCASESPAFSYEQAQALAVKPQRLDRIFI